VAAASGAAGCYQVAGARQARARRVAGWAVGDGHGRARPGCRDATGSGNRDGRTRWSGVPAVIGENRREHMAVAWAKGDTG
jgi:hypothetical protein